MNLTIPNNFISIHLPKFKDVISPEYKTLRKETTAKYGQYTLISTTIIIILLPILKIIKGWYLRRVALRTNTLTSKRESIWHKLIFHSEVLKTIVFWSIFSFLLNYCETFDDLMFISKRLGRVSCACLPALLFITLRPSPLPKTLYLSLLPIHKWLSRIVVLEGTIHTIIYLIYFYQQNTMFKVKKATNLWGIVAMAAFALIAITSLPKLRRLNFNVFYIMHYIMTWLCVISVHLHAKPGIGLYTILNIAILLFQIVYRVKNSTKSRISVIPISPTLSLVEFPSASIHKKNIIPGGHIRMNNKQGFLKDWFYTLVPLAHPFTIASLPNDPTVKLIIRKGKFPLKTNKEYYITGAFDAKLDFIREQSLLDKFLAPKRSPLLRAPLKYTIDAQRVMIVVGGSGISFGIPLLRILNYNGISARLMWVCKDIKDLNLINHFKGTQGIECYITGDVNENDINIDYLEDTKDINPVLPVTYGSTEEQEEDEIDFTTIGKSYKEAHQSRKSVSTKSSSDTFKEHENVNIDISNSCGYGHMSSTTMTQSSSQEFNNSQDPINILHHYQSIPESLNPESFKNIKIPQSVKIFYGRPNLGSEHYDWCLQSQCVGPTLRSGQNVCCRDIGEHDVDKSKIWVVAAGPTGLVDHAKQWAIDGGLRYHIESFSV